MKPLYNQLMDSKSAPRVAPKAHSTQLGTAPMNLRSAMQKYARGGDVKNFSSSNVSLDNYSNYSAKENHEYVNIPGVGNNILMFWDHPNKRVVVSDEGYWNPDSPVGDKLKAAVDWAHNQGYQAGVVVSPYSSDRFGDGVNTTAGGQPRKRPGATDQQLRDYIDSADFVVTDPYIVSQATATPEMQDNFASFTKNVGDYANEKGKDSWLFLQGFGTKDVDPKIVEDYNNRLATENAGRYNDMSFFNLSDFGFAPGESVETFGDTIYQLNTKGAVDTAAQAAQPFKMAEKIGVDLPTDWNNYGANDKINWFNNNNVSPSALAQSGVAQGDIDWMTQNGYTGATAQQQPQMMAQAQPQAMTGIAALGGDNGSYQSSSPQPVDIGNGLRRTYGGTIINSEGYPVDENGQRLDNPYASRQGGVTLDDGTFIAGVDNQAVASPYAKNGSIQKNDNYNDLRTRVLGTPYASKEDIENFNRSVFVPNPNEYGRPQIAAPVDPMPQTGGPNRPSNPQIATPATNTGGYSQPLPAQQQTDNYLNQFNNSMMGQTPTPAAPDYSRSYAALGGADTVNNLRNQFLGMGLDENTIGSIFSQYYAPQQPVQQMARGGMAHSDIEQYLTRLGMIRK